MYFKCTLQLACNGACSHMLPPECVRQETVFFHENELQFLLKFLHSSPLVLLSLLRTWRPCSFLDPSFNPIPFFRSLLSFAYWFSSETEALYKVCPHAEMLIVACWIMPYREYGAEPRLCTESMTLMFQPQTNVHMCTYTYSQQQHCVNDANGYIPGMATSTRFQMTTIIDN